YLRSAGGSAICCGDRGWAERGFGRRKNGDGGWECREGRLRRGIEPGGDVRGWVAARSRRRAEFRNGFCDRLGGPPQQAKSGPAGSPGRALPASGANWSFCESCEGVRDSNFQLGTLARLGYKI